MKAIGSNHDSYIVSVRGMDKPIRMNGEKGEKLSNYLISDSVSPFVHITDVEGVERTIRVSTIDRVEKFRSASSVYKTVEELHLPSLVTEDYQERVYR